VLVEDDPYALAALRYLDRNPVRAGLVNDPGARPWSSCAAYPGGADNRLATFNPAHLGLSPSAAVRQRQYRKRLEPSEHPRADARDPRCTAQRAVGSDAFVAPYRLGRPGRPRVAKVNDDLDIQEGTIASVEFCRMISGAADEAEKVRVREALLRYCERDTVAMVELRRVLFDTWHLDTPGAKD
jgi:hypothetical protein